MLVLVYKYQCVAHVFLFLSLSHFLVINFVFLLFMECFLSDQIILERLLNCIIECLIFIFAAAPLDSFFYNYIPKYYLISI